MKHAKQDRLGDGLASAADMDGASGDRAGFRMSTRSPKDTTANLHLTAGNIARLLLCTLLTMSDGFDNQAIGFVAPAIAKSWHLSAYQLGPIFSAGLFGAMVGASVLGGLGDRKGLIRSLTLAVLLLCAGSLGCAFTTNFDELLVMRIITGLGLGGALPNLMTLAAEQAPLRLKASSVSVVIIGIPLGAGLGGLLAASLVQGPGWQSVFLVGGLAPLLILCLLIALTRHRAIDPTGPHFGHAVQHRFSARAMVLTILAPSRRVGTLLLWAATFLGTMLTYTLSAWLPLLLSSHGHSLRFAVLATSLLNLAAVVGGACAGRAVDLWEGSRSLGVAYAAGGLGVALIGWAVSPAATLAGILVAAIFALGGNTGIGAITTIFYPQPVRATGIGLSLTIGRLGAVAGPLMVGLAMAEGASVPSLFYFAALIAFAISLIAVTMGNHADHGQHE